MRSIKLYLTLVILFLFVFALPNSASAFPKYKVALLPVINTAQVNNAEVSNLIQYKIHRKLRFPFYEFIPDTEITSAVTILNTKNGYIVPDQNNLSLLSQTLSADIVLVVEIVRARADLQHSFSWWDEDEETIETTDVLLKYYAYSVKDNKYYENKAAKFNSAPLNVNSGLIYAVDMVIDDLLKKIPFKTIPDPVSPE